MIYDDDRLYPVSVTTDAHARLPGRETIVPLQYQLSANPTLVEPVAPVPELHVSTR